MTGILSSVIQTEGIELYAWFVNSEMAYPYMDEPAFVANPDTSIKGPGDEETGKILLACFHSWKVTESSRLGSDLFRLYGLKMLYKTKQ